MKPDRLAALVAAEIRRRVTGLAVATHPRDLTVGVEHEFFLVDAVGAPATHDGSQDVLRRFGESQVMATSRVLGPYIEKSRLRVGGVRVCILKYDHHPHLLELELPWAPDLHQLAADLEEAWAALARAVAASGLLISSSAVLRLDARDPRLLSPLESMTALRYYRTLILEGAPDAPPDAFNYAALIAATQTHVGGLGWWAHPETLRILYGLEPDVAPVAFVGLAISPIERFNRFLQLFHANPLAGFPALATWSVDEIADALVATPLAGGETDSDAARTVAEVGHMPASWDDFFARVRDLPVIRPRLFGTVEHRSDPAQPSPREVLGVAALRLGVAAWVFAHSTTDVRSDARDRWRAWVDGDEWCHSRRALILAEAGLRARGRDESSYLAN